nr:DUF4422 domain-containing protein [Arcticibacterium luteifluviistationis]
MFHFRQSPILSKGEEIIHLLVGNQNRPQIEGFKTDDTGDNISDKNKYYSELTGLYWIWKNEKADIIGSTHYRRHFTAKQEPLRYRLKRLSYFPAGLFKKRFGLIYTNNVDLWKEKIIKPEEILAIFKDYEAIMPVRRKFRYTIKEHYRRYHNLEDLKAIERILKRDYPDYMPSFEKVLEGNRLFANNMFILKYDAFNELMTWLFDILFKLEEEFDLNKYTGYQERIFGFLSERLITIWIEHHQINYKELPLIYFKKFKKMKG